MEALKKLPKWAEQKLSPKAQALRFKVETEVKWWQTRRSSPLNGGEPRYSSSWFFQQLDDQVVWP
jgi:hypothetical protein